MTRDELIQEIIKLHSEMKATTLEHGVPKSHLAFKTINIQQASDAALIDAIAWLRTTRDLEYKSVIKAWNLVTPDTWVYYEQVQVTDMQEQVILDAARENLKQAWRNRPLILQGSFNIKRSLTDGHTKR